MRIAFDAQPLLDSKKTGVGFHEAGLVTSIMNGHKEHEYFFECFAFRKRDEKEQLLKKYIDSGHTKLKFCTWFPAKIYRIIGSVVPHSIFFSGDKIDITHFFNFLIPFGVKGKKVVTVHDMAFRRFPETVRLKTLWMLRLNLRASLRRADAIIAVSEFTKKEIIDIYGVSESKIHVVPNGVDLNFFHAKHSREEIETVKSEYSFPSKYFLYLGSIEPRKNLINLIHAYFLAKKNYEEQKDSDSVEEFPSLVIAGGKGWLNRDIYQALEEYSDKSKVVFPGYLSNEAVPIVMQGAEAFLFPSLYEGFGMPVIEAMACGTPVVTSASTSLQEIGKGAAVLVNANSVSDIASGILMVESLRGELVARGLERAREFTWERSGEMLHDIYKKITK